MSQWLLLIILGKLKFKNLASCGIGPSGPDFQSVCLPNGIECIFQISGRLIYCWRWCLQWFRFIDCEFELLCFFFILGEVVAVRLGTFSTVTGSLESVFIEIFSGSGITSWCVLNPYVDFVCFTSMLMAWCFFFIFFALFLMERTECQSIEELFPCSVLTQDTFDLRLTKVEGCRVKRNIGVLSDQENVIVGPGMLLFLFPLLTTFSISFLYIKSQSSFWNLYFPIFFSYSLAISSCSIAFSFSLILASSSFLLGREAINFPSPKSKVTNGSIARTFFYPLSISPVFLLCENIL